MQTPPLLATTPQDSLLHEEAWEMQPNAGRSIKKKNTDSLCMSKHQRKKNTHKRWRIYRMSKKNNEKYE